MDSKKNKLHMLNYNNILVLKRDISATFPKALYFTEVKNSHMQMVSKVQVELCL